MQFKGHFIWIGLSICSGMHLTFGNYFKLHWIFKPEKYRFINIYVPAKLSGFTVIKIFIDFIVTWHLFPKYHRKRMKHAITYIMPQQLRSHMITFSRQFVEGVLTLLTREKPNVVSSSVDPKCYLSNNSNYMKYYLHNTTVSPSTPDWLFRYSQYQTGI